MRHSIGKEIYNKKLSCSYNVQGISWQCAAKIPLELPISKKKSSWTSTMILGLLV